MQRDMDLVRNILLKIEADQEPVFDEYSQKQINYHVKIMGEARLIEILDCRHMNDPTYYKPVGITWYGHDFLDSIRNDTVWNNVKKNLKELGGKAPTEVISRVGTKLIELSLEHLIT